MSCRIIALLMLIMFLPGCGGTQSGTSNLLSYRTADVFSQGGDATLELGRTTEGTMTGAQLGSLTPDGTAPIAAARDENGTVVGLPPVGSDDPGAGAGDLPY